MEVGSEAWWELRDEWARPFALLGAYGYRPKLTREALVGYRADGSRFVLTAGDGELPVHRYDSHLRLALLGPDGATVAEERFPFDGDEPLVLCVLEVLLRSPEQPRTEMEFIRYFPPESELDRMRLAAAYASYRAYLDALASRGIHAYLERSDFGLFRIYSDISPKLLLDISLNDEGLGELGPEEGEWVVFLAGPNGYEAEFTVDRLGDDESDSDMLADSVAIALADVLRGGHPFFEHYDARFGRLDPNWLQGRTDWGADC